MRNTRSSAKKAAKAKLSGYVPDSDNGPKNKKIVFDDVDVADTEAIDIAQDAALQPPAAPDESDEVEEVKGSTARESTQKLRNAERQMAKETTVKKKRKRNKVIPSEPSSNNAPQEFNNDFFNQLESERAEEQLLSKKKKIIRGKHTTFVVEDEHCANVPKKHGNIEVIALGSGKTEEDEDEEERRILLSATLGSTSAASTLFARGNLVGGASRFRSCESRKRGTKDDDAWKRSNTKVYRSGPGSAAMFFKK